MPHQREYSVIIALLLAKPAGRRRSSLVDLVHHTNLGSFLFHADLVDADSIRPQRNSL
jgi:hypothetical protein